MKTILLSITIMLSATGFAQQDTTRTDSVKCIDTRIVLTGGALAFSIFYSVAKRGFQPLHQAIFRRETIEVKN